MKCRIYWTQILLSLAAIFKLSETKSVMVNNRKDTPNRPMASQSCPVNFVDCDNGLCVRFELVNDGKDDCGNGRDEQYTDCPKSSFKCHQQTKCLHYDFICDGQALTDNCATGSDEWSCFCPRKLCKGHCVPKGYSQCEGYPECDKREEENLCLKNLTSKVENVTSRVDEKVADSNQRDPENDVFSPQDIDTSERRFDSDWRSDQNSPPGDLAPNVSLSSPQASPPAYEDISHQSDFHGLTFFSSVSSTSSSAYTTNHVILIILPLSFSSLFFMF